MSVTSAKAKPAVKGQEITLSDSTEYNPPLRAIWVGVEGTLEVMMSDDTTSITLVGITAGTLLPLTVKQVLSTGSTASSVVGFY